MSITYMYVTYCYFKAFTLSQNIFIKADYSTHTVQAEMCLHSFKHIPMSYYQG